MKRIVWSGLSAFFLISLPTSLVWADETPASASGPVDTGDFYFPVGQQTLDLSEQSYYQSNEGSPHSGGIELLVSQGKIVQAREFGGEGSNRYTYTLNLVTGVLVTLKDGMDTPQVLTTIAPGGCGGRSEGYSEALTRLVSIVDYMRKGKQPIYEPRSELDGLYQYLNGALLTTIAKCASL